MSDGVWLTSLAGGGLFGFDISSMSAIISTQPYLCQFNEEVGSIAPETNCVAAAD